MVRIPFSTIVAVRIVHPRLSERLGLGPKRINVFTCISVREATGVTKWETRKMSFMAESRWKIQVWYDGFVYAGLIGKGLAAARIQSLYRSYKARKLLLKIRTQMGLGSQLVQRRGEQSLVPRRNYAPAKGKTGRRRSRSKSKGRSAKGGSRANIRKQSSTVNQTLTDNGTGNIANTSSASIKLRNKSIAMLKRSASGIAMMSLRPRNSDSDMNIDEEADGSNTMTGMYECEHDVRGYLKRRTKVGVLSRWKQHYFELNSRDGCLYYCDSKEFKPNEMLSSSNAKKIEVNMMLSAQYYTPLRHNRSVSNASVRNLRLTTTNALRKASDKTSPLLMASMKKLRKASLILSSTPTSTLSFSSTGTGKSSGTEKLVCRFVLRLTDRSYHLMAETPEEAKRWVDALLRALPRENVAAVMIQCAIRCYLAKSKRRELTLIE